MSGMQCIFLPARCSIFDVIRTAKQVSKGVKEQRENSRSLCGDGYAVGQKSGRHKNR